MAMALAGDTDERQHSDLDRHIAGCVDCARQWRDLSQNAATVEQARPAATETSADPVAAALERIRPRPRGRKVRIGWTARAAAVALMVAAALWMTTRPPDKLALLVRVEAALRQESWRLPNGDVYTETSHWAGVTRAGGQIYWGRDHETGEYGVVWQGHGRGAQWSELRQREEDTAADQAGVPPAARSLVGYFIREALANGDELVEASEAWGELEGNRTRVISLSTRSKPLTAHWHHHRHAHDVEAAIHLEPASDRVVRITMSASLPYQTKRQTFDIYPIRYDVEPPPSISMTIPEGTMVAMHGGTYEGDMVDPVWEHMSEAERERLTEVVRDTIGGWAQGDFAAFAEHYDFAGVTEYGVKGKFTPEEMAEYWRRDVERRRGRYQTCEVRVDYAVATAKPPGHVVSRWSIERTGLPAGEGWITYRDEPTDEPGIAVFGRMTVTQTDGKTRDAATLLFLKQVEGDYRVIGWVPPF
jgi:hypothetical protein